MMHASSLTYVYGNYDRLYIGPVGPSNLKAFVTAVSVAGIVIFAGAWTSSGKEKHKSGIRKCTIYAERAESVQECLLADFCMGICSGRTRSMPAGNGKKSAYPSAYMTSYAYLLSSGIMLMPVIFIAAFFTSVMV